MIDYAQSFDEFASSLKPTDLALYAGVAIVLWILFKDRLNPVTNLITKAIDQAKELFKNKTDTSPVIRIPVPDYIKAKNKEDVFFDLVVSWKKTRDLAVAAGCDNAVKVADQMFPFLSPNVCNKSKDDIE